jgi:hypothetical protein
LKFVLIELKLQELLHDLLLNSPQLSLDGSPCCIGCWRRPLWLRLKPWKSEL